jgi:hypothetical protein
VIRTPVIFLEVAPATNSLLAHNEQEKASPTYAEPKAGGNVRLDDKRNSCSAESAGSARDIEGGILAALLFGRGCCSASDGRESLSEGMRNDGLLVQKSTYSTLELIALISMPLEYMGCERHTFQRNTMRFSWEIPSI